jgi:predicted transcriptional regulator
MDDIVGILSDRDLNTLYEAKDIPVEVMMNSPVEFVDQNLSVRKAILLMLEKKISCLLVANENEDAAGIITTDDLLWQLAHILADETADRPFLTAMDQQTIGQVANELSMMGI